MQLLATAEQMQQFDSSAINKYSLPGIVLMENAGRAFVDVLEKNVPTSLSTGVGSLREKHVVIVCGKGNNGGDGFVIARHLSNRGAQVHVVLLCKRRDIKGDAKTNLDILLKIVSSKKSSITFDEVSSVKKLERLLKPDVIVDAIFGTGFSGEVRGFYGEAIEWINNQQSFVTAVDIPSGVNSTTGIVENIAVKANLTVTMGLAKIGHYVGAGREHSGNVEVVDISIPNFILQHSNTPPKGVLRTTLRVELEDVKRLLPKRPLTAHKYSVGTILVIAGSRNLTGAPIMTALSAMRSGAGAVILAVPKSIHAAIIRKVTEVMVTPLDETDEGTLSLNALEAIEEKLLWADVVALGPGIAQHTETRELVYKLIETIYKPLVLDADALGSLAYNPVVLKKRKFPTIITPHVGELRLMTKLQRDEIELHRVEVARKIAKQFNCVHVLKGAPTATGTPDGRVYLNSTGNPGMATAGSGDVLTGIISSLLAQGMELDEAAYCGVFIHGMAGDIAARKFGERSLMALDILDCIHETFKAIEAICLNG